MKRSAAAVFALVFIAGIGTMYYIYTATNNTLASTDITDPLDSAISIHIDAMKTCSSTEWTEMENVTFSVLMNTSRCWLLILSGALESSTHPVSIFIRNTIDTISSNETISASGGVSWLTVVFLIFLEPGNHTFGFEWKYFTDGAPVSYIYFGGYHVSDYEILGINVQMIPV